MFEIDCLQIKNELIDRYKDVNLLNFLIEKLCFYSKAKDIDKELDILLEMFLALLVDDKTSLKKTAIQLEIQTIPLDSKEDELLVLLEQIYSCVIKNYRYDNMSILAGFIEAKGYAFQMCLENKVSHIKEQNISYEFCKKLKLNA